MARKISEYNKLIKKEMNSVKNMKEAAVIWKARKSAKSVAKKTKEKSVKRKASKKELEILNRKPTSEKEFAMDFATKVHKKFDRMIKASVLFGSHTAGKKAQEGSDIDIILIIDDASIEWDLELISWYREELGKIIATQPYAEELHINTVKLTTWWYDILRGDPVVVNILRYGEALIDSGGFFNPLKALLLRGKIKSTPEAVHAALARAPGHIVRSKIAEMGAVEGAYWALVDSAQAALMTVGELPPSPEHIPELLKKNFVDSGLLKSNYVDGFKRVFALHKSIMHREISDIDGAEIDKMQDFSEKFLGEMVRIIDSLLKKEE